MHVRFCLTLFVLVTAASTAAQSWEVVPTPDPSSTFNILRGIDGVSEDALWAVGEYDAGDNTSQNLVLRWTGSAWEEHEVPNPQLASNSLWDVGVLAEDRVWSVGIGFNAGFVLEWDGATWEVAELPDLYPGPGFPGAWNLTGIHTAAEDAVWAIGQFGNPDIDEPGDPTNLPLALRWDGSSWEQVAMPPVGDRFNQLWAIAGSAPDNVWAVGRWGDVTGEFNPLVYRWDGEDWAHVPTPFADGLTDLHHVAVLTPDDVWVSGERITGGALLAHWDGSGWTAHDNPGGSGSLLALGSDDIYGFGSDVTHWDGTSWTTVDELSSLSSPSLLDATALTDGTLWAAGRTVEVEEGESVFRTLTIRSAPEVASEAAPGSEGDVLSAAHPNPARTRAQFTLEVAEPQRIRVVVYDTLGRRVAVLHDGEWTAGRHALSFEAIGLPSGTYLVHAEGETFRATRRVTLVK